MDELLVPHRVALIGASPEPGSVGDAIWSNLLKAETSIELHAVGHHRVPAKLAQWHDRVALLPPGPGVAILAVPAPAICGIIREIGAKGWKTAVVVSAGLGRNTPEGQAMLEAAREQGVRLVGPNCLGVLLPGRGINGSFAAATPPAGNLALLSQSGAIATAMIEWAAETKVGFSAMLSVGDMADIGMAELVRLLGQDERTQAILIYLEGLTDAADFLAAASEVGRQKPIVVLKGGRSALAGKAALSHTGALAGSWEIYRAAFVSAGVICVDTLEELCSAATILRFCRKPAGNRLAVLTNGGGAGILAVDALTGTAGWLAELASATSADLRASLPPICAVANPLDIVGDADGERYSVGMSALMADPQCDAVLVINCPTGVEKPGEVAEAIARCVRSEREAGRGKPVLACWLGPANFRAAEAVLAHEGIASFADPAQAVRAFDILLRSQLPARAPSDADVSPADAASVARADSLIARARAEGRRLLSEVEAKELLSAFGIPVVATRLARTAEDVANACAGLDPPYVVKIVSRDISHKSEVGGVALALEHAEAARAAAKAMLERVAARAPEARIDGFAVQSMIERKGAIETFAGIAIDPTFGPVLMFGAGGTAIEVINDKAVVLPPVDRAQAMDCISRTRIAALLRGYRDRPPCDLEALAEVLQNLSRLAVSVSGIAEIDINPLLADTEGVLALDARVVLGPG